MYEYDVRFCLNLALHQASPICVLHMNRNCPFHILYEAGFEPVGGMEGDYGLQMRLLCIKRVGHCAIVPIKQFGNFDRSTLCLATLDVSYCILFFG